MRDVFRTDFAQRVLDARKKLGLSQTEMAKRAGISQSTVGEIETTARGSSAVASLARVLHVDPYWLQTGEGERSPAGVPFTPALKQKLLQLPERELVKVENMLRASFEMEPIPMPEKRQEVA